MTHVFATASFVRRVLRSALWPTVFNATTLAASIAVAAISYTLLDSYLLRPVPFHDADRLFQVSMMSERGGRIAVPGALIPAWRALPVFAAVEAAAAGRSLIQCNAHISVATYAYVSPGLPMLLGVHASEGRLFVPGEGRLGAPQAAVLSEELWRRSCAGHTSWSDATVTIDGADYAVVGLLPRAVRFPEWNTEVWIAHDYGYEAAPVKSHPPSAYVRMAQGVPIEEALRAATVAAHAADPAVRDQHARARPVSGTAVGPYYTRAASVLIGAVWLMLSGACVALVGFALMLVWDRRAELAIRAAVGASPAQLTHHIVSVPLTCGAASVVMALGLGMVLTAVAASWVPQSLHRSTLNPMMFDMRVTQSAALVAAVIAGIAGLVTRHAMGRVVRSGSPCLTEKRATLPVFGVRPLRVYVAAQVAFACVLLAVAVTLVLTLLDLLSARRGVDVEGVVVVSVALPETLDARVAVSAIRAAVAELPGVTAVTVSQGVPPVGGALHYDSVRRAGSITSVAVVEGYYVDLEFFDVYGVRVVQGGVWTAGEVGVAVVSSTLASQLWPGGDALGGYVDVAGERLRVVGIAEEISVPSVGGEVERPEFFRPLVDTGRSIALSARCRERCPAESELRRSVASHVGSAMIHDVFPAARGFDVHLAHPRALAAMSIVFAVVALTTMAASVFGLANYSVRHRRWEYGLHLALGASPGQLVRMVLRENGSTAAVGSVAGVALGYVLIQVMALLQLTVTDRSSVTLMAAVAVTGVTVIAASVRPAVLASRSDPVSLLRAV